MQSAGFAIFETPIGACGVAWGEHGLRGVQLPESREFVTRARLAHRFPDLAEAAAGPVAALVETIRAHLAGARVDYSVFPRDERELGDFERGVYAAAAAIPHGETRTYGQLATGLGDPQAAQAVGQALGRNPWPIVIPCHRITAADGRFGGFSAPGGVDSKRRLLEIEGALAPESLPLFATRTVD